MKKYKFDVFGIYTCFKCLLYAPVILGLLAVLLFNMENPPDVLKTIVVVPFLLVAFVFLGMKIPLKGNPELYMDQNSIVFIKDGVEQSIDIAEITLVSYYPGSLHRRYRRHNPGNVTFYHNDEKILIVQNPSFHFYNQQKL